MKKILMFATIALAAISCATNENKKEAEKQHAALADKARQDTANYTSIQWLDTAFDFGQVKQGEKLNFKYRCVNTGTKPLVLLEVKPGCGCTLADYSREAILPGKQGWVTASFDTKKYCDAVHKSIAVETNCKEESMKNKVLTFGGTIIGCPSNDKVVEPHPTNNN